MPETYSYIGDELDVFAHARNWKAYFRRHLAQHIRGDVLEVGAGIGATTRVLHEPSHRSWTCLEPDAELAQRLRSWLEQGELVPAPAVVTGTIAGLDPQRRFDTILYIDVLEHIEDDAAEVGSAAEHLRAGGKIIALSPAHQGLYSPFDEAIGHCRRYSRRQLMELTPAGLRIVRAGYLDSAGLIASLANRLVLRQSMPTLKQIRFWDGKLVPISRAVDGLLRYRVGKSVMCVWEKQ